MQAVWTAKSFIQNFEDDRRAFEATGSNANEARDAALQRAEAVLAGLKQEQNVQLASVLAKAIALHLIQQAMPGVAEEQARASRKHPFITSVKAAFEFAQGVIQAGKQA